jgi:protease I
MRRALMGLCAVIVAPLVITVSWAATPFLDVAKETGITIEQIGNVTVWKGKYGGNTKPSGPLLGKRIGVIVASEFSDWQAYYFVSYIGEFGGICEWLLVDWVTWKETRPNVPVKTIHGMWGLSLDPIPVMGGDKAIHYKSLKKAKVEDYDAILILGGHSGDVMVTEKPVIDFVKAAAEQGKIVAGIGGGIMPMIRAGIMKGKKCTGNRVVDYMLRRIADYRNESVVVDGKIITGRDTADAPAVLRAIMKTFSPSFQDRRKGILKGKRVMFMVTEDFEDIELCAPMLELMYRGAEIIIGAFKPQMKSRPALLGLDVIHGNFGVSIPVQEIPESYYRIIKGEDLKMSDFDCLIIPGAFNPWQITVLHRDFLRDAYAAGKIIAAICHGPIPLAAADLLKGRHVAGWLAVEDSVNIMGGTFHPDWAAAIDGRIVTGRTPPEVPEFVDAITEALLRY